MTRFRHHDSFLVILGLLVTLCGAGWAALAVIIDEKTADQLAATMWGANAELKQTLLDQSRAAGNGLALVALGSFMQIAGVALQAIDPAKKK